MTRLILWRHGQTEWNIQDRFQGQQDVGLDDTGRSQAVAAAYLLAAEAADLVISSDLRRARHTAEALAVRLGLPVSTDPRLRERGYGDWEGLTHGDITRRWPAEFARWKAGESVPECGVEDPADVAERVGEALLDAATRVGEGTAVLVSHGGAVRQGLAAVLGWPREVIHAVGPLGNCHWAELRRGRRGWRLHAYNVGPHGVPQHGGSPDDAARGTLGVPATSEVA